ncbi:hypothetical protein [Aestuariimicrobium ganziense]|uniref:hypothetical protein n=1 Tax=Aestuariimicrobium ganziense TaxID=2773677 RepID=UPI0038B23E4A
MGFRGDDLNLLGLAWATSRVWLLFVLLAVVVLRQRDLWQAVSTWDVQHFMAIARNGYATAESRAFFPGVPGLMEFGDLLGIRPELTGVLVGAIGSALAAAALYRMGGVLPAALWLVAPTTVFTFVGYTEAPFCAAAFWAWERWRKGHWLSAALLATVACTFRVSGLFLVGALVVLTLLGDNDPEQQLDRTPEARARRLVWLALPSAALIAHAWHLKLVTGSWSAWYQAQVSGWNRGLTSPLDALANTWKAAQPESWPGRPEVPVVFFLEIVSMLVGIVASLVLLKRRRWASASWIGVHLVAFGTSYWYMSINRAVLLWFPLFLLAARFVQPDRDERLQWGRQLAIGVWMGVSALVAGAWAWILFTNGWAS